MAAPSPEQDDTTTEEERAWVVAHVQELIDFARRSVPHSMHAAIGAAMVLGAAERMAEESGVDADTWADAVEAQLDNIRKRASGLSKGGSA